MRSIAAVLAAVLLCALPALAEGPAKEEGAKEKKVRRLLKAMQWEELFFGELDSQFEFQEQMGALPPGFGKQFRADADMEALLKLVVAAWAENCDDPTLDAAIAFYETPLGQKFARVQGPVSRSMNDGVREWAMATSMKTMGKIMEEPGGMGEEEPGEEPGERAEEGGAKGGALGSLRKGKLSANETAAIATLRTFAVCQAHLQTSGKIDCDSDGIGEYGTLMELTGSTGVRHVYFASEGHLSSSSFSSQRGPILPPILSKTMAGVDKDGIVTRSGYCFRIFLPEASSHAGFVHEGGSPGAPRLIGESERISVDLSETTWCAYAWPEKRGETGNRAFFVNQSGDVLQSANDVGKWEGTKRPVRPDAAFRGAGITSEIAIGTAGRDGDVWKLTN